MTMADRIVVMNAGNIEPLGSETQIVLAAGDHTIVAVTRARTNLQPDEVIWIRPAVEHVLLFGSDGRRLNR